MPPSKNRKDIEFDFDYEGAEYYFDGINITTPDGLFVCKCDITAYNMEYNELNLRICCRLCLDAYCLGYADGKRAKLKEIQSILGIR